MRRLGVIADTHGMMRPAVLSALEGSDQILHAGDIGSHDVVEWLEQVAPVVAVRGNVDGSLWASWLPDRSLVEVEKVKILLVHDASTIRLDEEPCRMVVYGHTHRALVEERQGVLFLNPGSAGPERSLAAPSVARILVSGDAVSTEIVQLEQG